MPLKALKNRLKSKTPKRWRLIGKTFLFVSSAIGGAQFQSHPDLAKLLFVVAGAIGYYLCHLTTDKPNQDETKDEQKNATTD